MTAIPDHFSAQAEEYARSRPRYPAEMFVYLAGLVRKREIVWDVGCGNGQASVALAAHFDRVIATDISDKQLRHAHSHERVEYIQAPAEASPLEDGTADLIVAAQSAHWFNHVAFYGEVRRVAAPGAVIALISYEMSNVTPEIDPLIYSLANQILGTFWPRERSYVDSGYATLPFPFDDIEPEHFEMSVEWTAEQMLDYLLTWSATQRYIRYHGADPRNVIADQMRDLWGKTRTVRWPLSMRLAYVDGRVR